MRICAIPSGCAYAISFGLRAKHRTRSGQRDMAATRNAGILRIISLNFAIAGLH